MRLALFRSCRSVPALALAGALLIGATLAPTPAHAYHGGYYHGGYGLGVGLGFGLGFAALGGWPGYYYPYGPYPYDYYPPAAPVSTIVVQAPVAVAPPAAQSYYYCSSPQGYYPYVATCSTPWQQVPVAPPAR